MLRTSILRKIPPKFSKLMGARGEATSSYTYPLLHPSVVKAVSDKVPNAWFHKYDDKADQAYVTHVMGKFTCNNSDCSSNVWNSMKVAIQIKGYPGNGYNATVFGQRCRSCNKLGDFSLNENSYIKRIAYRLKKWAGAEVEIQPYRHKGGPPHESDYCEGCRLGICTEGDVKDDNLGKDISSRFIDQFH
ncbi:zinc-binding domain-containing protein [Whalleya microplaca]|nr:zinc-binding domain-containing protein [Whalleya microplaca]